MEHLEENKLEMEKKSNIGIQDYLSIGYITLLVLGIIHETIYYKFIDINILEYSSILDVLISPVSVITGNLVLGIAVLFSIVIAFAYTKLIPKYYYWLSKKPAYKSGKKKEKLEKSQKMIKTKGFMYFFMIFYVFAVYVGLSIGKGGKTKERINADEITLTHEIFFEDGEHLKVRKLGKNSLYLFYVSEPQSKVSISPIDGNIKTITRLIEEEIKTIE